MRLWHRANSAKPGGRVPRSRDLVPTSRIQHVVFLQASQGCWGPRHRSFLGKGVGGISFGGQKKRQVRIAWLRLSAQSPQFKSKLEISLVQPRGLERLIDVSSLAPDGLGDLSSGHSFLTQRHDACAVESDRATLVNALRLRGVDAGAMTITDEAKLHLGDHTQHRVRTTRPRNLT
jgi:hypothetical protein